MIFDTIKNASQYYSLGENIKKGFEFIINSNLKDMPDGKYSIEGDSIFANIQTLNTKPPKEARWEAHRKYIDIQYVIYNQEKMGYGILDDFKKTVIPYDDKKDITFLEGKNYNYVDVQEGNFVIFYPNDVHAPMLSVQESKEIKKVIIKIKI